MLVGAVSGSIVTYFLGYIGDKYDIDKNPEFIGTLTGSTVLIAYLGCIPFFILNAHEYARMIKFQKQVLSYVNSFSPESK
jgi:hypothetical protein